MESPAWHTYFEFHNHSQEAVLGAFILAVRELEWSISEIDDSGKWTVTTGIPDAANNETIQFHRSGNKYYFSSETSGEVVFTRDENKRNIDLLHQLIHTLLTEKPGEYLEKTYADYIEVQTAIAENDTPFTWKEYLRFAWEMIIFKRPMSVTFGLILLNVLVFVVMAITGAGFWEMDGEALLKWGANYTGKTLGGQYWRLITNTFLHGGFFHVLFNMYGLVIGGLVAENLLGKRRFLVGYLLCGLVASAFSLYMHDEVLSVGASGAIFGCFGIVLGMASTSILQKGHRAELFRGFGIFVVLNLVNGIKGNIDNWAHMGGLVSGWVGGYLWGMVLKRKEALLSRRIMDFVVPAIALGTTILLVVLKPNYFPKYINILTKYDETTARAIQFYPRADTADAATVANLRDSGLYYLDACESLLQEAEKISGLPKERKEYVRKIGELNQARRDVFYYVYKRMSTMEENHYNDSIEAAGKAFQLAEKRLGLN